MDRKGELQESTGKCGGKLSKLTSKPHCDSLHIFYQKRGSNSAFSKLCVCGLGGGGGAHDSLFIRPWYIYIYLYNTDLVLREKRGFVLFVKELYKNLSTIYYLMWLCLYISMNDCFFVCTFEEYIMLHYITASSLKNCINFDWIRQHCLPCLPGEESNTNLLSKTSILPLYTTRDLFKKESIMLILLDT